VAPVDIAFAVVVPGCSRTAVEDSLAVGSLAGDTVAAEGSLQLGAAAADNILETTLQLASSWF